MTGTVTPLRREGSPLTRDQRALVKSVPGLAERVAYDVSTKMIGGDPRSPDRVQTAHLGIYKAAQTHDADLGDFSMWAYWKAVFEVLTFERRERRQRRLLTAGRIAGARLAATRQQRIDLPADASDDELKAIVAGLAEEQVVGELLGIAAASEDPPEHDEDLAERSEWDRVTGGLLGVLGTLQSEWREFLLSWAHGHDVKALAVEGGVDYSNTLTHFRRQLALVRARLHAQNIDGVPRRPAEAPAVLPRREPPAPRRKPGECGEE